MKITPLKFSVVGSGEFPLDMLRYDGVYPLTEGDANLIRKEEERRTVWLVKPDGDMHWIPNIKRWKSFGWTFLEGPVEIF